MSALANIFLVVHLAPKATPHLYLIDRCAFSATAHFLPSRAAIMASSKLKIYGIPPSAPCRVVYLTCHVLGLDYEVIPMDPRIGQTKEPEFLKVIFTLRKTRQNVMSCQFDEVNCIFSWILIIPFHYWLMEILSWTKADLALCTWWKSMEKTPNCCLRMSRLELGSFMTSSSIWDPTTLLFWVAL